MTIKRAFKPISFAEVPEDVIRCLCHTFRERCAGWWVVIAGSPDDVVVYAMSREDKWFKAEDPLRYV